MCYLGRTNIIVKKTKVLHIGHQREELDIELEGKKLTHAGRQFRVPRWGSVRAVEGVMADRQISKRLKGKAMNTCVTPACLYGTETLTLAELEQ